MPFGHLRDHPAILEFLCSESTAAHPSPTPAEGRRLRRIASNRLQLLPLPVTKQSFGEPVHPLDQAVAVAPSSFFLLEPQASPVAIDVARAPLHQSAPVRGRDRARVRQRGILRGRHRSILPGL